MTRPSSNTIACPSCGGADPQLLDFVSPRASREISTTAMVYGCEGCGLVFVYPPPSTAEIEAHYGPGGSWEQKLEKRRRGLTKKMKKLEQRPPRLTKPSRFVDEARQLREEYGAYRVLDFGCGDGKILNVLQDQGWETAGLDPVSAHKITRHTMLKAIPTTPSYDLVIMKHVIEHLPDPLSTLRAARAALFDGGHLIIGVPSLDGLAEHGKKGYCINRSHHLTAYTARSLRNLLALAGFGVVKAMNRGTPFRMGFVARATADPERVSDPLRDVRREFRRAVIAEEGWFRATFLPVRLRARRASSQVDRPNTK